MPSVEKVHIVQQCCQQKMSITYIDDVTRTSRCDTPVLSAEPDTPSYKVFSDSLEGPCQSLTQKMTINYNNPGRATIVQPSATQNGRSLTLTLAYWHLVTRIDLHVLVEDGSVRRALARRYSLALFQL